MYETLKPHRPEFSTLRDYLFFFAGQFRCRRNFLQKKLFIRWLIQELKLNGYPVIYDRIPYHGIKTSVILAGELKTCKKVIICALDTPLRALNKNYQFYPFDEQKNKTQEKVEILLSGILLSSILIVTFLLYFVWNHQTGWSLILWMMLGMVIYQLIIHNKNNFNKSSCSLALLMYLSKIHSGYGLIFIDHNAESNLGLQSLYAKYKSFLRTKEVCYMDCIASGKTLIFARTSQCKFPLKPPSQLEGVEKIYNNPDAYPSYFQIDDQLQIMITGMIDNDQIIGDPIRNNQDRKADIKRLEQIVQWLADNSCTFR